MCRVQESQNGSVRTNIAAVSPEGLGQAAKKQQHLITDDGFATKLALNLLVIGAAASSCALVPSLRDAALDAYFRANEVTMAAAHRLAWWSLLGLLSSSCCALQIVLNAVSFGCAGFNAALGPMRPTFVALTLAAQGAAWYVALPRPWLRAPTAASTALSVVLTLLPEMLAARTARREGRRREVRNQMLADRMGTTTTLRFRLGTMGCASCVSTVSRLLEGVDGVQSHRVSLEDGIAEVVVADRTGTDAIYWSRWKEHFCGEIIEKLETSGFPASVEDGSMDDISGLSTSEKKNL